MKTSRSQAQPASAPSRGFTLVEVLVVVATVALLLAILLPSLRHARSTARTTACAANLREIGGMIGAYQGEFGGFVPLVYDYWSNTTIGGEKPAEQCRLSVALRRYHAQTRSLEAKGFDPAACWKEPSNSKERNLRIAYEQDVMPDLYACPFIRDDAPWAVNPVFVPGSPHGRLTYGGRWESYATWAPNRQHLVLPPERPAFLRGDPLQPSYPPQYRVKYSTISFVRKDEHCRWSTLDARKAKSASLAELTAVHCAQGEFIRYYPGIRLGFTDDPTASCSSMARANMGSHSMGDAGGTNALFADLHGEWVAGTQIGRP